MPLQWIRLSLLCFVLPGCASAVTPTRDDRDDAGSEAMASDAMATDAMATDASASDARAPARGIVRIGVGANGGCGVDADGSLWCWGAPAFGRDAGTDAPNVATRIDEARDVADVSPFLEESMVLQRDGTVSGWGFSHHGQLGEAIDINRTSASVLPLPGVHDIAKLAAGHHHVCVITSAHRVQCWGGPYSPSLGVPGIQQTQTPVTIPGLDDVVDLSASVESVCVVRATGEVWCWGAIVGPGGSTGYDVPTRIDGITDATQVAAGWFHTCVLHRDGTVSCWGENTSGEVGDGTTTFRGVPVRVPDLTNVTQISAGDSATCALRADGSVTCWGLYPGLNPPVAPYGHATIAGIGTSVQVASNAWQACALSETGDVHCWGREDGPGDSPPVIITGLPRGP